MIVTVLVDNNAREGLTAAHGLSLYVETDGRRILFDFGPKGELLLQNAEALGVDLSKVDFAVLSHGHYDHSGGLEAFLRANPKAPVYAQKDAFQPHYVDKGEGLRDISADVTLPERYPTRIKRPFALVQPGDGLICFALVPRKIPFGEAYDTFFSGSAEEPVPEDFHHEMHLLIREGLTWYLLAGCAHQGIANVLDHVEGLIGKKPAAEIAGLHLIGETPETVATVGDALKERGVPVCTCHCTGSEAYAQLSEQLGTQIRFLQAGDVLEFGDD